MRPLAVEVWPQPHTSPGAGSTWHSPLISSTVHTPFSRACPNLPELPTCHELTGITQWRKKN